jgi:hypothetical protein
MAKRNEYLGAASIDLGPGSLHNVEGILNFAHSAVAMFKSKPSFPKHLRPVELRFGCF